MDNLQYKKQEPKPTRKLVLGKYTFRQEKPSVCRCTSHSQNFLPDNLSILESTSSQRLHLLKFQYVN